MLRRLSSRAPPRPPPWFVDAPRPAPPHLPPRAPAAPPPPADAPAPLRALHTALAASPLLDPAALVVARPTPLPAGPPLPDRPAQGRRRRGRTFAGIGIPDDAAGVWAWVVLAQVKDGAEDRGAIESVVRAVRKNLLAQEPPVAIPPNAKRRAHNGWAMIDAGTFAVHILSRAAREKYFGAPEW